MAGSQDPDEYKHLMEASAGMSIINSLTGAFTQSRALTAQGDIESTISGINSNIASLQSKETLAAGDLAVSREDLKTTQEAGSILANQGASGTAVGSGSNVLTRNAVHSTGQQDALTIRNNAQRQAFGYNTQALEDTYQGKFATLTAQSQSEQTLLGGGLQAIQTPVSMYANALLWQRRLGGGSGSGAPFPNQS